MSLTARMLLGYMAAIKAAPASIHRFSHEHCCRVLASALIGGGR